MPCGSTISNPTFTMNAPSSARTLSLSDVRWWKIPLAPLTGIVRVLDQRRQYRELLELDDRLLADIGLTRATVEFMRDSPLYLIAWRDSR